MTLIVDATADRIESTAQSTEDGDRGDSTSKARERRRIDVTDLRADGIEEFVESNVDTDRVSLEHCGARTYLVVEE